MQACFCYGQLWYQKVRHLMWPVKEKICTSPHPPFGYNMRQSSSALLFALFLRHTCITLLTMTKRRQLKISNLPHLNMSSISNSSTWDWCIAFTNQVKWGRTHPRSDLCTKTVLYSKHPFQAIYHLLCFYTHEESFILLVRLLFVMNNVWAI